MELLWIFNRVTHSRISAEGAAAAVGITRPRRLRAGGYIGIATRTVSAARIGANENRTSGRTTAIAERKTADYILEITIEIVPGWIRRHLRAIFGAEVGTKNGICPCTHNLAILFHSSLSNATIFEPGCGRTGISERC
jgi:hypothetical protein